MGMGDDGYEDSSYDKSWMWAWVCGYRILMELDGYADDDDDGYGNGDEDSYGYVYVYDDYGDDVGHDGDVYGCWMTDAGYDDIVYDDDGNYNY